MKGRGRAPRAWQGDPWDHVTAVSEVETAPPRRRAPMIAIWVVMAVFAAAVVYAGSIGWWYLQRINPGTADATSIPFVIEDDDTYDTVVARLLEDEVIVDADVFDWYVERNGGLEIVPGFYRLVPGDHLGNVLGRLRIPPERTFNRVTFPEGFTVVQMGERLGRNMELMDADEFIAVAESGAIRPQFLPPGVASLEGLLFPDTYDVSNSESEAQVIERMVAMMERVARQENLESRAAQLGLTPYEVLIIASMIEREAKLDEDRAKISAVIRNRLFIGMPLQIDATLFYDQDPSLPFNVIRETDTPYNTYLNAGLPPTPIANPGRASIRAALYPAPNPPPSDPVCRPLPDPTRCALLYYVLADERGGHAFAATFDQHLENIEQARADGVL
jgi:UPF0755 protein